jgi:hypothetical protein
VCVEATHFNDPIRPSTLIVNNITILKRTTVVGSARSETGILTGSTPQRVVVNDGPGLDLVRKATGKNITIVPIREAASHTPVPSGATRRLTHESRKNENPASKPDLTGAPEKSRGREQETAAIAS